MSTLEHALENEAPTDMKTLLLEPLNKRELPNDEKLIVLKASKIYRQVFKPCGRTPDARDLTTATHFVDGTSFRLPMPFSEQFIGWMRPEEAFQESLAEGADRNPSMKAEKPINLVQDAAHDCSLVAGMCALVARTERGFPSVSLCRLESYI
jgi:calpain-7